MKPPGVSTQIRQVLPQSKIKISIQDIEKLKTVGHVVLTTLSVIGVVAVSIMAPNALKILNMVPWQRNTYKNRLRKKEEQAQKIIRTIYYLKRRGYINLTTKNKETQVEITEKGKKRVENLNFKNLSIPGQKKWDGHWWFVFADIPSEDFRVSADQFRRKIKDMGLYPLQRTVWVYPFNPKTQVLFAAAWYSIDRFVSVVEAVAIDEDDENLLKKYFKL